MPTDQPVPTEEPASRHLTAELHPVRHRGLRKAVHLAVLTLGEASGLGGPSIADLVVLRRDTGLPVIRTKAGPLDEADALLRSIRADLDRMPVAAFLAEWGHLRD